MQYRKAALLMSCKGDPFLVRDGALIRLGARMRQFAGKLLREIYVEPSIPPKFLEPVSTQRSVAEGFRFRVTSSDTRVPGRLRRARRRAPSERPRVVRRAGCEGSSCTNAPRSTEAPTPL